MNNYRIDNSWTKFYKIEQALEPTFFEYLKLVYLYSNGKELLLEVQNSLSMLILHDIEKETKKYCYKHNFSGKTICHRNILR